MTWNDTDRPGEAHLPLESRHTLIRRFTPHGFQLAIHHPEGSAVASLEPADALALAADIQREYGGKEC